jgi:hypothetical protein
MEVWKDGEKGWRLEADDLADVTLAAQVVCKEVGVPFDPSSVLVFADYEGNIRLNIKGLRWRFDEENGTFNVKEGKNVQHSERRPAGEDCRI